MGMFHFYKSLTKKGKVGFIIFLIINASFLFLLISPYIPNYIGEFLDNQLLEECSERIQQYRTGPVSIRVQFINGTPVQNWNISFTQIRHEFLFGCNIYSFDSFNNITYPGFNEAYRLYFKNLFNLAVLPFYWSSYEPSSGLFPTESGINQTLVWCSQNNITAKGHPLVWSREAGTPSWLPLDNDSEMIQLLQNRISTLVTKYKNQIEYWDVINEPTHTNSFAHLSELDYVRLPLQWANNSNPAAHLTINEYGIEGHDFGYGPFYQLASDLIATNAPIDSIGMQGHEPRTDWIPATELWATLDAYAAFGKPVHITEFCPVSAPVPITNSWRKGLWSELEQAEYARRFYMLCFSHPTIGALIWWDLCDLTSWLEGGGLFRADMTPKPVYTTLSQLINQEWRSSGSQITNSTGWIQFRGFYGLYNISSQNGAFSSLISVNSGAPNQIILEV